LFFLQDNSGVSRGFGFITFADSQAYNAALSQPSHILAKKTVMF